MVFVSRPSVKPGGDSELFCLPIEGAEMRLKIGYLPDAHPETPLDLDNFPMMAGDIATAPCPADLLNFGKDNHRGKGSGQGIDMRVFHRRPHLELVEQGVLYRHSYFFTRMQVLRERIRQRGKSPESLQHKVRG
jgi:hypothetical protein